MPEKIFAALFAFENSDYRIVLFAVRTKSRDIDPVRRTRGTNLHCTATETAVIRPEEGLLLQSSMGFRFAGWHGASFLRRSEARRKGFQQRLHRFDCLVAHIGDAERLPFNLPIAAVDLESVLLPNPLDESCHIDLPVVPDAGQSNRSIAFLREKFESVGVYPFVHEAVGLHMTLVPVLQPFGENLFEL